MYFSWAFQRCSGRRSCRLTQYILVVKYRSCGAYSDCRHNPPLAQHPINNKNKQRALFSLLTKADKYKQPISSATASDNNREPNFSPNVNPRPFSHQLAQPCSTKSFLLTYLCPQKAPLFICATCRSPFFAQPSGA